MIRRWFIRICFMLPILLCVGGWAWSTHHASSIFYARSPSPTLTCCGLIWGEIIVQRLSGQWNPTEDWSVSTEAKPFHFMHPDFIGLSRTSFLGFYFEEGASISSFGVALPLWFPILIFSALLIPVWRKTRPKLNPKTAFPVETSVERD